MVYGAVALETLLSVFVPYNCRARNRLCFSSLSAALSASFHNLSDFHDWL